MNICPICSHTESHIYSHIENEKGKFDIKKCCHCSLFFTSSHSEIDTGDLYNDEVYMVIDNSTSIYSKIIYHEYNQVLKTLKQLFYKGQSILDFGSGKGIFLFLAQKAGYSTIGIETAKERAEFAEQKYKAKIIKSEYNGGKVLDTPFDIITLFHVLEHLPNPKNLLRELIDHNLNEDGLLVLEVPNMSSLQSAMAKSNWMHLDIPRHLSHFTSERLIQFAEELNLKPLKVEYFSWHLGVLGMCQSILSVFGYKRKIIKELKYYNIRLIFAVMLILPFAILIEIIASLFKKGGIVRLYCQKGAPSFSS